MLEKRKLGMVKVDKKLELSTQKAISPHFIYPHLPCSDLSRRGVEPTQSGRWERVGPSSAYPSVVSGGPAVQVPGSGKDPDGTPGLLAEVGSGVTSRDLKRDWKNTQGISFAPQTPTLM